LNAFYPARAPIDAYGNGGFRFAGMSHQGSLLVLPSGMHRWDVGDLASLKPQDFELVFAEGKNIEFLLLGTGVTMSRPAKPIIEIFARQNLPLDFMSTGSAVRTYGVLLSEKRKVAAAFIAVQNAT
jgi:uncharacterized protein